MPAPAVHRFRLSRRVLAVSALALTLAAFPLGVLGSHQFGDVPDSNLFHADIDALADSGVTTGCGGGNFCPSAFVTREQMAAFMNRLGALGPGKVPVVDADRLDGLDSTAFYGEIMMSQAGPWAKDTESTLTPTFQPYTSVIYVNSAGAGEALILQDLVHPTTIGTTQYALAEVQICWTIGSNVVIDNLSVLQSTYDAVIFRIQDITDVNVSISTACHTWNASVLLASSGGVVLEVDLAYSAAGSFRPSSVRSIWVPVP